MNRKTAELICEIEAINKRKHKEWLEERNLTGSKKAPPIPISVHMMGLGVSGPSLHVEDIPKRLRH